jgi:hypothetical protein
LGVGGSAAANLTADETWHDEEMPLASLAHEAEIRLKPSHSGTSRSHVPRDEESNANTSSEKDEEQQEFIKDVVRGGYERGRRRGRGHERGRGRGRGWNPPIVEVGEIVLSDDEEVSQRVIIKGRQRGGS